MAMTKANLMTGGCPERVPSPVPSPAPTGWACPVCGKGNAPHADRCGHCADQVHPFPLWEPWRTGQTNQT